MRNVRGTCSSIEMLKEYMARENLRTPVLNLNPVPSLQGSFGGLSPPNKAPSPPNWNMKRYKPVEFLSIFRMSSHPAQTQTLPQKRKAPLLKSFWRRFCLNLGGLLLWLIHNMVYWFAWKQVKQNNSRTVKWREQQQNISLLNFETLQKQKLSPNWQADRGGP